ncbi:ferritin-like superfamily [Umbelopsis sp. AD052]|nr:ferritin-like superfamily [Umbelopsis sp. AD052]
MILPRLPLQTAFRGFIKPTLYYQQHLFYSTAKMSSAMKISDSMLDGLINQANEELNASNLYLSMSLWFHDLELPGSAQWCRTHSEEERTHALKIFDHIVKRRAKGGMVRNLEGQKFNFETPVQAWEFALNAERENSKRFHRLMAQARNENDFTTDTFLQWFINEQLEEESAVEDIVTNARGVEQTKGLYREYDKNIVNKDH